MPYRDASRIPRHVEDTQPDPALVCLDIAGRRGADGISGNDGNDGAFPGADGARGGHATLAQPGRPAGALAVTLTTGDADGLVRLSGTATTADGAHQAIEEIVTAGTRGLIELLATGGNGGDGGNGGNGGNGARGARGSDATRYSSGDNGGPGGDGGDGGNATSGGPGGDGGRIEVFVDEADTQLLMLVAHRNGGGSGGKPGRNGRGGRGGSGGPGGSSYSWTESETYTDDQGQTQTRTSSHYNSGGSSGPDGRPGRDASAPVTTGAGGRPGTFQIHVRGARGVDTYPSRYDLRLVSFRHTCANQDGVYEPQETIRVFDIVVENTGGMPTPAQRDIHLGLVLHGWITPRDEHLTLPRALGPGERCRLDGQSLQFVIGDYQPLSPGDALAAEEVIRHRAWLPAVQRDFGAYESDESREQGRFPIRFPVHAGPLRALHSIGPGEATRLQWRVSNDSRGALGADSPSGRVLRTRLALADGELGAEHVLCFDEHGTPLSLADGVTHTMPQLGPGEHRDFEVIVGLTADAPTYRSLRVVLALELGRLDEPAAARPIQYRDFTIQSAQRYRPIEGAELLLVTNHRTTHAVIDAWEALVTALRVRFAIWNLSLEGSLDLDAPVAGGRPLREQFAGGTVVILDNAIETDAGPAHPREFVAKHQILAAAGQSIHVAWLGSDFDLRQLLVPAYAASEAPVVYPSPPELLEAFRLARTERSAPLARQVVAVDVHARAWLGGEPGSDALATAARWLQQRLSLEHPDRRHVVIHDFAPEVVARTLWIKRWRLGRLLVGNMLDTAAGTLVHAAMPDETLTSAAHVQDDTYLMALLVTRSFHGKLERLADLLAASSDDGAQGQPWSRLALIGYVVDALCADLANEMIALLASPWREGLTRADLERSLPLLDRLVSHPIARDAPILLDSDEGAALIRMLARLRFFLDNQVRLWEWLMAPWRRAVMLRSVGRALLDRFVDRVFGARGDADRARRACGALARKAITAHARQLAREHVQGRERAIRSRIDLTRALLRAPIERQGIHTSAEELVFPDQRVLSRAEHETIVAADAEAASRRDTLARAVGETRAAFLVALPA